MTGESSESPTPLDPGALSPGASVLVAGPAMTGKRRLLFELVGGSPDRAGVFVTTKRDAGRVEREFREARPDGESWDLRLVDCVSRSRDVRRVRDTESVRYVSSAGDLTGVGIAVSGFMREFHRAGRAARVGLHSLSTLLMYADLRRVYQFVHVVTGRIESSDFCGVFTLDTAARNTEALDVLAQVFDALVEVRNGDDGPQLRVRGEGGTGAEAVGPRGWTPF